MLGFDIQVLVKDLLRKYPQWSHDCIAVVGNISSQNVQEPKAKAALIWMLGEYSQDMSDAPYILESLTENWDEEHSAEVIKFAQVILGLLCFFPCLQTCLWLSDLSILRLFFSLDMRFFIIQNKGHDLPNLPHQWL